MSEYFWLGFGFCWLVAGVVNVLSYLCLAYSEGRPFRRGTVVATLVFGPLLGVMSLFE